MEVEIDCLTSRTLLQKGRKLAAANVSSAPKDNLSDGCEKYKEKIYLMCQIPIKMLK